VLDIIPILFIIGLFATILAATFITRKLRTAKGIKILALIGIAVFLAMIIYLVYARFYLREHLVPSGFHGPG
jgi:hypothetical protein